MDNIRIGNSVHVTWRIWNNAGTKYALTGRVRRLWLASAGLEVNIGTYETWNRNELTFTVDAADLTRYGTYKLVLQLRESDSQMEDASYELTQVFQVVSQSYPDANNSVNGTVEVEFASVLNNVIIDRIEGLSAYEIAVNHGFEGSEEQWIGLYNDAVDGANGAAIEANAARIAIEAREGERVSAEADRVSAESARVLAESARVSAESARENAADAKIADMNAAISDANAATSSANSAASSANSAASSANSAASSANSAASSANSAASSANSAASSANSAASSANSAASSANSAADAANATVINDVEVSVDNATGTPSASVSFSNHKLSFGFSGLKGETGATGATGATGKSAYQSWLDQGNVGTEEEFVESLKGDTGPQGLQGPQGNTGSSVDYPYELVNNLTTDDATKALSAKQGKVLGDEVSQLRSKADAFVLEISTPSVNLFDKTAVSSGKNIKRTTGEEQTNTSYDATDYIPIDSRGLYCDKAYGAGTYVGAAVYDSSKQYIRGTIAKTITYEAGDAYVRFSIKVDDVATAMCVAGTSADLPGEYVPFDPVVTYKLKDGLVEPDTIQDDAVTFDKIGFRGIEIGKNKLNPADVVSDVYINQNNGNEVDYSGAEKPTSATGFIPISKKGLHFNVGITFGVYCGAAVYDVNKQYLRSCGIADYYYETGDGFVRWSFRTSSLSIAQVEEGNVGTEYEAYSEREVIDPAYLPSVESEEEIELKVFLPDTIFAVVGDTLQIFYQSLVRSVDVSNYNVKVSCSKGSQFHRYFEYTPEAGDVGNTTFRITVLDDFGTIIGSASCNLVTVAAGASPSSGKKIVCVGASTTANGKWPAETFRRLTGSGGTPAGDGKSNIVFCGNKTKDGAGYVGYSGWSWLDYATQGRPAFRFTIGTTPNVVVGNVYTNNGFSYTIIEISDDGTILCSTSSASNEPQASGTLTKTSGSGDATVAFSASALDSQNPFWDYQNNKLTFVPFANSYCGGTIDAMYLWLGGNGLTNWDNDFEDYRGYMEDFADTLHTEFPSAKIYLVCGSIPSMKLMMPGHGASGAGWADTFGMIDSFFNLRKFYQEFANDASYSGFVEFVDASSQFDSDYNFPLTQKAVNTRNSSFTEPYANNTIHPGDAGYMQIADSVYRHFVAKFCQS